MFEPFEAVALLVVAHLALERIAERLFLFGKLEGRVLIGAGYSVRGDGRYLCMDVRRRLESIDRELPDAFKLYLTSAPMVSDTYLTFAYRLRRLAETFDIDWDDGYLLVQQFISLEILRHAPR